MRGGFKGKIVLGRGIGVGLWGFLGILGKRESRGLKSKRRGNGFLGVCRVELFDLLMRM